MMMGLRSLLVRNVNSRLVNRGMMQTRYLSETAVATNKGTQSSSSKGPSFSTSLLWFSLGLGVSSIAGYYQLSLDVEACTKQVESSLAELRRDTVESQKHLRQILAEK